MPTPTDTEAFIDALAAYAREALRTSGQTADYCTDALRIVSARNHLFAAAGQRPTDESEDIYALRDFYRIDEVTMDYVIDRQRLAAIARNYFHG